MKLWQKEVSLDKKIETFTIGKDKDYDLLLAPYDVQASKAHAQMLESIDILTKVECADILGELTKIEGRIDADDYFLEEGIEDIHSQIELDLTRALGETGKKIHAGRSRNDQVLVALKLFYKKKLADIHEQLVANIHALLAASEKHKSVGMPGYTHTQIAMPSSFGMWFGCYAEALVDDANFLKSVMDLNDQNPLGSAAGYGNSFPLDRQMTTDILGFKNMSVNSMYAQMTRGKTEQWISFGLSSLAASLNRLASDVCLFTSGNFGFIKLPENITTGSSIMPHKKNPDVFELIRARTNQLVTLPTQISMINSNLMSGYHRDVQILKEVIFPAIETAKTILELLLYCIPRIEPQGGMLDDEKYKYLFSVEEVNRLVMSGMSFREAYRAVGKAIEDGDFEPDKAVTHSHVGSVGDLGSERILGKLE